MRIVLLRGVWVLLLIAVMVAVYPRAISAPALLYPAGARFAAPPHPLSARRKAELTPEQVAASFKVMPQADYFAAFAVGPDGRYGWAEGRHTAENARTGALSRCGTDCEILAEVHPFGYDPAVPGMSLSGPATRAMAANEGARTGQPIYYALAPDGTWAAQTGADGWFLPQLAVLRRCRTNLPEAPAPSSICTLFHGPVRTVVEPGAVAGLRANGAG